MKQYFFRCKTGPKEAYIGYVSCSEDDLFTAIDEFIDPYQVEIAEVSRPVGFCFLQNKLERKEIEFSEFTPCWHESLNDELDWFNPDFERIDGVYVVNGSRK